MKSSRSTVAECSGNDTSITNQVFAVNQVFANGAYSELFDCQSKVIVSNVGFCRCLASTRRRSLW